MASWPIFQYRTLPKRTDDMRSREEKFLEEVEQAIHQNLSNDEFDVSALAQTVCISVSQLNRRLNSIRDCSAGYLIREIRMNYAARLLTDNAASVGEISAKVGYKNQAHFSRSFKEWFGCSPSEYSVQ